MSADTISTSTLAVAAAFTEKTAADHKKAAAAAAAAAAKPIISKRFKTTLCQSFEKTGRCPYVSRCMFAHGRRELRTAEQNVTDGLTSDEAIKEWKQKRAESIAVKKAQSPQKELPATGTHASSCECHTDVVVTAVSPTVVVVGKESPKTPTLPLEDASTPSSRSSTPVDTASLRDSMTKANTSAPTTPQMRGAQRVRGWRHDPYAMTTLVMAGSPLALAFGSRVRE